VVTTTLVVYVLLGGAETLVSVFTTPADTWSTATAQIATTAFDLLGATFIAGFFGRSVGAAEHGLPEQTTWQVLGSQPYSRLIRADFAVAACVIVSVLIVVLPGVAALHLVNLDRTSISFAFVIPGIVILTLLGLVGSAIKLERRTVISAIRRSPVVVRPHFWTVFALITVPMLLGSAGAASIQDLVNDSPLAYFVVRVLTDGVVAALCGLTQSELGYRLLATTHQREATVPDR
jgi:hypothetical protein